MKKIEKDILFKDLDFVYNEYELKKDKLNSIISLYMDEEPDIFKNEVDRKIKETEENNKKNEEKVNEEGEKETKGNNTDEKEISEEIDINSNTNNIELPKDIKSLYRKIVMMIHPDKNKNKSNLELYSTLYKRIIDAKNNGDKSEILYIGYKLSLKDVYDIDEEHYGSIRKKIKEKKIESKNITYNSFWVWYHTDNKNLKKIMTNQINHSSNR